MKNRITIIKKNESRLIDVDFFHGNKINKMDKLIFFNLKI